MALPDLTGQNIENTYQRVLQTDGTIIYDGTGSVFLPVSASYSVTASYAEYAVSASHEIIKEVSSSYADYSKESGLSTSSISASYAITASYALNPPDIFPYTGSAVISGSLEVIGDITGSGRLNLNDGSNNVLISTGNSTITTSNTVAVGYQALNALTTGTGNTAIGYQAGDVITTGTNNTLIGHETGGGLTTGQKNVEIGKNKKTNNNSYRVSVGYDTGGGNESVAIGDNALNSSTGTKGIAIGRLSGGNFSGNHGIFIGYEAGAGVGSGTHNVFLGFRQGKSANNTSYNVSIGGNSNALGHNNVVLGYEAGQNLTTASDGNVLLGYEAGNAETGSNKLYIENSNSTTPLIYGEFDNDLVRINGKLFVSNSLDITGSVSASTYYGDGSNLTGIETDPFPYTGSAVISGSLEVTGSISSTDTVTAVTGSFSHLKGNSPITVQDPVTFQHEQGLDVLGNATIHSINEVELQTISKDISYTSSINITEIPSSVNSIIIDYRLTNFNSGSRVGTFMYAHDDTTLSYNDLTIPGAGIGTNPILSASLSSSLVTLSIENAAGFNFTGYAKKFNKLGAPIPIANPNAPIPLLDTYNNAEAAFSLRKLSTLHTGSAIRVREDGFDTELDIGFDINNNLDTSTLSAHCGSNNGYVVTWYDQSGNNNDATQTAAANQPQIVSNGNVIFEGGNPAIQGTNSSKLLLNSTIELPSEFSHFTLCTTFSTDNPWGGDASGVEQTTWIYFSNVNTQWRLINSAGIQSYGIPNIPAGTLVLQNHNRNNSNSTPLYLNGDIAGTPTVNGTFYVKVIMGSNWFNYAGRAQEIIFYKSDQSSNREGIETNINTHYNIYDTGLLAEYSGAAAAYSIRQLTTAYTGSALRIREDGTNTETDIGFDSNGDLDTASIASHCGANNGLVVTWYDQSGNGNNATQSTVGNQPKIYDSATGVVTENGKPAVLNQGGLQELLLTSSINSSTNISAVAKANVGGWGYLTGQSYDGALRQNGGWYANTPSLAGDYYYNGSLYLDGILTTSSTSAQQQRLIFANAQSGGSTLSLVNIGGTYPQRHWNGPIQEIIYWGTDQSGTPQAGIETNINSYFNIYP